jgi:hypothetical protein
MLPERLVPNGIALTQVAMTGTRIFGPLLAAALIAWPFFGTGGAYLVMGGIFVVVVGTLWQLPNTRTPVRETPTGVLSDLADGARHVAQRPRLALLAISFILVVMTGYSYQVVLPGYLENALSRDAEDLGILVAATAVTGLVVTVAIAGAASSRYAWSLMLAGAGVLGVSMLVLSVAPNFAVAIFAMLLTGAGTGAFQMLNNALVMQESAPEYYGRVMSLTMMAWGVNGLAGFPFGLLADYAGERTTVLVMGIAVLVITAATAVIYSGIRGHVIVTPAAEPLTEAIAGD